MSIAKHAFATRVQPAPTDFALLLIRLIVGVVFIFHGSQKVFGAFGGPGIEGFAGFLQSLNVPMPTLSAWMAALAELLGGASILLGLGLRVMAIPVVITMVVAILKVHPDAFSGQGGMEYPLTLGITVAALAIAGSGRFSLDHALFNGGRGAAA